MNEADLIEMIDEAMENERIWRRLARKMAEAEVNKGTVQLAYDICDRYRKQVEQLRAWEFAHLSLGERFTEEGSGE